MPRAKDSVYAALNMFIILTLIITNNAGSSTINKQYVEPNFFLDDPNFSSMIYFVGTGSTESNRLFPIRDNVYEIISSSTFTTITIKANASGLTSWNLGTIYAEGWSNPMDFGNNSTTVGQFFVIIDGDISIVNTNFLGEFGIKVISPQGDHDISFLYLNRDENRYYYSYDHIVVRIRPQKSDFTDYISETFPVKLNISDNFDLDGTISGNAVIPVHGAVGSAFARNQFFRPIVETNLKYNSSNVVDGQEIVLGKSDELQITASGNSTGFSGLQILNKWNKIPGLWFYSDAEGIHEIDDGLESLTLREGNNYIGIHVFSPFGIWHSKITHPDGSEDAGVEWTVSDLDGGPQGNVAAIDDKGYSTIFVDSSFDFFGVSDGVNLRVKLGEAETVSSGTDDSIGFGTIITILTLIPIAMKQKRRDQY